MNYKVKTLKDSITIDGYRLYTAEVTFPRFIQAEFKTHRDLSGNAASSRAIPLKRMLSTVKENPVIPNFAKNQPGMSAAANLTIEEQKEAEAVWLDILSYVSSKAEVLGFDLNIHKQWVNRLIEPWMWITNIVSATNWDHFFSLRTAEDAQPEFKIIADMLYDEYHKHQPELLKPGQWHLPLIDEATYREVINSFPEEEWQSTLKKISSGRCARVSYLTHDGVRDLEKDIELHDRLILSGHMSPFEHIATPQSVIIKNSNFNGWQQYRKEIQSEYRNFFRK